MEVENFLPARQRDGYPVCSFNKMSAPSVHPPMHSMADVPRYSPSTSRLTEVLGSRQNRTSSQVGSSTPAQGRLATSKSAYFFEPAENKRGNWTFNFSHDNYPPTQGIKRRRNAHDVDGPNTAGLCCKKRRLRAELITSRLSQPFSQPATHILNREGAESGDKRFLKMATSVDAIRRIAHLHATSFLRFSVMNRIRKRLGIERPGHLQQRAYSVVQSPAVQPREVDATAKAPWRPQSLQIASGATYWRPSGVAGSGPPNQVLACQGDRTGTPIPKAAPPVPRVSKPTALPMPSSDLAAAKERTASRIYSVPSPELRPDRSALEDTEEDSFAFLHPDLDECGDDDPEHVYSDFGAIFRAGSPDMQKGDDHSYEEYLDELDGISWVTR